MAELIEAGSGYATRRRSDLTVDLRRTKLPPGWTVFVDTPHLLVRAGVNKRGIPRLQIFIHDDLVKHKGVQSSTIRSTGG